MYFRLTPIMAAIAGLAGWRLSDPMARLSALRVRAAPVRPSRKARRGARRAQ